MINLSLHLIVVSLVVIISLPIIMLITNKAIVATFDNYKYSQENLEKLYKQKLTKNKAYKNSLQYTNTK